MSFRLSAKSVFLTYPQCPAPRESIKQMLEAKGLLVTRGVIGQECHKDGNLHLHAYAKFATRINYTDPRCFDITYEGKTYHGDYLSCKSPIGSVRYITKTDTQPLELGDMDHKQFIAARESHKKVIGKRLIQGDRLVDVIADNPEMLMDYPRWKAAIEQYLLDLARAKPDCTGFIPNTWGLLLPILSEKKKHYWFWSDQPNFGKTKFLESIDAQFRASWFSKLEKYQSIFSDSQFILIDEFTTPEIKAQTINEMCDGNHLYPLKGGKATMCKAIILVCGNKDPAILYPNAWQYFEARFTVINLGVL